MSDLRAHIIARVRAEGPMRIDDYMATCLLHPTLGYYTTRQPFGANGDFVTAPEISQMFGEMIGLALAQTWLDQGQPSPFTLAELGPGRGTLMADALRATHGVAGFHDAARLVLVEASPAMRELQAGTLNDHTPAWETDVAALPDQPLFLIANEFFDALPIRQFLRKGDGWCERLVGLSEEKLRFGLGPPLPQEALTARLDDTDEGDLVEISPTLPPFIGEIGRRIARHGGAALIVDYGDWRSQGDTLQALRGHENADPLADPGQADLTAHVDFEAITAAVGPCAFTRLTPQGVFLERLGITNRAQALAHNLSGPDLESHIATHRRLTHPAEMGNLFKVIGLYPPSAPPPPGLEP